MIQIRKKVFETNSSSTHSLTMCSKDDYDRWQKGELYLDADNCELLSKDEALNAVAEDTGLSAEEINDCDDKETLFLESRVCSFSAFKDDDTYEHFKKEFTTKNGETVVAFGYYGAEC